MSRSIYCIKLHQQAEGLTYPPFPGELGKKIYQSISKPAWEQWLSRQTMYINEYRLNMLEAEAQGFLRNEMEKFLFGDDQESVPPAGFVEPSK